MNWRPSPKTIGIMIGIFVLIGGVLYGLYAWSRYEPVRNVSIQFDSSIPSVNVVGEVWDCSEPECENSSIEATLQKSGTLPLKDGLYYVTPTGDTVSDEPIKIEVTADKTSFDIKPYYSQAHLTSLLTGETAKLQDTIHAAYPISTSYEIGKGQLYQFGDWYATSLTPEETVANPRPDTHFVILNKSNDTWQVVGKPSLYFKYADHKDIPREIIQSVNSGIEE